MVFFKPILKQVVFKHVIMRCIIVIEKMYLFQKVYQITLNYRIYFKRIVELYSFSHHPTY